MKKLMLIAALMVGALSANAQNDELKNEISIGYGFGSISNIASIYETAFSFSSGDQHGFWGPVSVEYQRHLTPMISVGGIATIAGCSWDNGLLKDASSTYIGVMPSAKFNWIHGEHFGFYSKLGAGVMFVHSSMKGSNSSSSNSTSFTFQVSALGVEFGSQFRGFAELGFGEQGVLVAGLRYKF